MARLVSPIVSPRVSPLLPRPTRRVLLGTGLLGGAAAALTACTGDDDPVAAPTTSGPPELDPGDWASVRAQFGLDPGLAHFAAFVLSPHPAPVTAAIAEHRAALDRDVEEALLRGIELEAAARDAAASYTGAAQDAIALTGSTTEGIAIMYGGLDLAPGDEVLTTTHDFYSTEETLRLVAGRTGARVRHVSLYDDPARATVEEMVDRLVREVRPRTRVIGVTWVHSSTGVRVPVREIAEALGRRRDDVLLCVDGVHGFGAVDVDLPDLDCDFLASGTHKWLFGPRGTGILYGRQWPRLTPFVPSFSGPGPAQRLTPGGYHAFEHQWALPAAFGFHEAIGRDRVAARTAELATRLKEGLSGEAGVTVVTPLDPAVSAGIVCLDLPAKPPPNAVLELREAGIVASATPYATSYLRLGPSLATDEEQVDAAIEAVAALV